MVRATTTTCRFAENVFYEYWHATQEGDGSLITAYSPAAGRDFALTCTTGSRITCRASDGSYVRFAAAAADAYTTSQAAYYACHADLGASHADDCLSKSAKKSGAEAPDSSVGTSVAGGDCDSDYSDACLDPNAVDYDCAGGRGDGPDYTGQVVIVGDDPYGLDRDGDGIGCDESPGSAPDSTGGYAPGDPTTEDFGTGSGSVGQCADGTYSDSIGRPGACSHHGGVG